MVVSFRRSPFLPRFRVMVSMLAVVVLLSACQHRRPLSSTPPLETTAPPAPVASATPPETAEPPAPPAPTVVALPTIEPIEPIAPIASAAPAATVTPALGGAAMELPPGPVSVALLLPLSGPSADLGRALFEAAQLALFDVGNEDFVLLPRDTGGTPEGAADAARQALADGVRLVLGPLFSGSVAAVAPLTRLARVNVVGFSSDRSVARPGVYLMGFLPAQQVARVVEYAIGRDLKWFTALAPSTAYGKSMVAALGQATQAAGGILVEPLFFPAEAQTAADVEDIVRYMANYDVRRAALLAQRQQLDVQDDEISRAALRRLEDIDTIGAAGYDAVLLPEGGPRLLSIAPLFPYFDIDTPEVRLLGTYQWESVVNEHEPALFGGWFAAPPPGARADFETRFEANFGYAPPRLASLAYDAVALAGALAKLPDGRGFSAETLTSGSGFRGVDGIFRFTQDGANERGLAVLEVTPEGVKTIDEAPKSFAGF